MVLNIIFSYNRAMQLDYLLQSSINSFEFDYKIVVIFHTTGKHELGYQKLINKYSKFSQISFIERKPNQLSFKQKLTWKQKDKELYIKQGNFKALLESTLEKTECELVMFNTDDGLWLDKVTLDSTIYNLIKNNPTSVSYRYYVGENMEGFPLYVKKWGDYYLWNYYTEKKVTHWSYPFAVDGTVYNTKGLLTILNKVYYHNPVTLESNVEQYAKRNGIFSIGLSPVKSKLIGTKLNRVAVETLNPTIHINPDLLNEYYLNGYTLKLQLPDIIDNSNIVPLNVFVEKNEELINIYEWDELGKEVQANLGIEGAKKQME